MVEYASEEGSGLADIVHSVQINASPDRVRSLVSSASGFAQWWAADSVDWQAEMDYFLSCNTTWEIGRAHV